ncbi:MAG: ATP-binding protein [Armatimonadota bacterium]|nr:ATP-binding protein [Armatimonadota bacterium]
MNDRTGNENKGFVAPPSRKEIGLVVSGSLLEGLKMKLHPDQSVEDIRAGKFVVIEGEKHEFFSMITDVVLETSIRGLLDNPPRRDNELMHQVISGTATYGTIQLRPMLMLPSGSEGELRPVKTIPGHFSPVFTADKTDVSRIFGDEKADPKFFHIGTPLDMEDTPVCLNLDRFVERSNGIFGKSGTGKTFLTRIVLCGIIKNRKAVNLVFDMHSEYGWKGTIESDGGRAEVRGLKQYFQDRVAVFSLDPESSRRRGAPVDFEVKIPYSQVTVDDIILLQNELNLAPTALETSYALINKFGESLWLSKLVKMSAEEMVEFCQTNNIHQRSLEALQRKLKVLTESCKSFLIDDSLQRVDIDAVKQIMSYLDDGKHVVLEFGQHTQPLRYMLVANILTRRIHDAYVKKTEEALGGSESKPTPLIITIEEAHKFLSPPVANQTIFGTIAREMRKYNVTLLVVDQRPSGIDDEVLSQVGTRITCLLNDERDIDAVLTGVSNASGLRGVLATLDSKQQALILGHAVPMPIVIQTRFYDDEDFRLSMGQIPSDKLDEQIEHEISRDFA